MHLKRSIYSEFQFLPRTTTGADAWLLNNGSFVKISSLLLVTQPVALHSPTVKHNFKSDSDSIMSNKHIENVLVEFVK